VKVTEIRGDGNERTWKVETRVSLSLQQLDNLASMIEEGEIDPGSFRVLVGAGSVPPELAARLAVVLVEQ